jgi:hypothetical protein
MIVKNKMVKSSKTSILESLELSKKEQKRLGIIELVDWDYSPKYDHHQNYIVEDCTNDSDGSGVIVYWDKKSAMIKISFIKDILNYIYEVELKENTHKGIFNQILEDGIKLLQSLEK